MAVSIREVVSFGRYEPLFRIASGGMAEVYAARIRGEAGFQKLVAIKRMHPHLASDRGFVDMFLNEARLAAHVASPYVVQTLDLGRGDDGSLYIVMELVLGLSLAVFEQRLKGPFPPPIALEIIAQAAQGLEDAHEATTPAGDPLGLIHRDVSPHNILLGLDGRARMTDFGIARAVHRPREETNVRELKGKFAYMSPEQTRLLPVDRRTDVFSLGIVLWELLVGKTLFAERAPTACIQNVRHRVIPAPHKLRPAISEAVSKVTLAALERDPARRLSSAGLFAEELRRVGRESYGRLPSRKGVAKFVRESGDEELDRLQRLIRMGTEGAEAEQIEALQTGVMDALSRSGVSRVDHNRVTARLEEQPLEIPTVTLPPEGYDSQDGSFESASFESYAEADDDAPTVAMAPDTEDSVETRFEKYSETADLPTRILAERAKPPPGRRIKHGVYWLAGGMLAGLLILVLLLVVALSASRPRPSVPLPVEPPIEAPPPPG